MKRSRKAQMKMIESLLVLVVFFFLLMFGIVFYAKFSQFSDKRKKSEDVDLVLLQTSQRVQYLPEIQCTKDGTHVEADCFDMLKLDAFEDLSVSNYKFYSKLFPNTLVTVTQVFPDVKDWVVYNHTFDQSTRPLNFESFFLPITLYNSTAMQYSFGFVTIGVYY